MDTKRLAAAVLTLAALTTAACASSEEISGGSPEAGPPEGKLAIALRGKRGLVKRGLVVTDFQGRELRKIAAPGRVVVARPAFSASGDELWFLTAAAPAGRQRYRLHIHPTSGRGSGRSSPVVLDGVYPSGFLVSPQGDRVAIGLSSDIGSCGAAVIVDRNGRRIRALNARGYVGVDVSSWSRDGSRLLYTLNRYPDGSCGKYAPSVALLTIHHGDAAPDQRIASRRDGWFKGSAWSPDGRRIAFSECDGGDFECRLILVDPSSRARRDLGALGIVSPARPVWAVKANEIVTPRSESNPEETEVWAVSPDSGARRKISDLGGTEGSSLDGSRIVESSGVLDVESGQHWPFPESVYGRTRFGTAIPPEAYFVR